MVDGEDETVEKEWMFLKVRMGRKEMKVGKDMMVEMEGMGKTDGMVVSRLMWYRMGLLTWMFWRVWKGKNRWGWRSILGKCRMCRIRMW